MQEKIYQAAYLPDTDPAAGERKETPIPENRNKALAVALSPSDCRIMASGVKECILDARIKGVKGERRYHPCRCHGEW